METLNLFPKLKACAPDTSLTSPPSGNYFGDDITIHYLHYTLNN